MDISKTLNIVWFLWFLALFIGIVVWTVWPSKENNEKTKNNANIPFKR